MRLELYLEGTDPYSQGWNDATRTMAIANVRLDVHGRWMVDEDGNIECSVCGHHGVGDLYCERCGARMDEEDDDKK